jgi:hypothetical protein
MIIMSKLRVQFIVKKSTLKLKLKIKLNLKSQMLGALLQTKKMGKQKLKLNINLKLNTPRLKNSVTNQKRGIR